MGNLMHPIVGIENRTAQEVFDIMCDRFRSAQPAQKTPKSMHVEGDVHRELVMTPKAGSGIVELLTAYGGVDMRDYRHLAAARITELEEALRPFAEASDRYNRFWAEETGGQSHMDGEDAASVTFFALGSDVDMVPLAAFRSARAALGGK